MVMKTHLFLIGAVSLLGTSLLTTSYAANTTEYLHFTRHRDSNGNLLMAPTQHHAEPSLIQKTVVPSQPKMLEQRSTDWGMSVQEVKEIEPIQSSWDLQTPVLGEYETRIAYKTQIEGIPAALTYSFYQDHLGQAKYVFEPQHEDEAQFVNDFYSVEDWISQSYGAPISVQEIWLNDLYQYDKSLWGLAVKRGQLVMVAEWNNPGTDIVLVLDGGNDEVGLVADFASTTFVVPVSLDTQSQEESIEAAIEEPTFQEALPAGTMVEPVAEDVPGQDDMTHEIEGSPDIQADTEIASQEPVNEIDELKEIEQMLNEEYPILEPMDPAMEGSAMDSGMNDPMFDDAALEAVPATEPSMPSEEIGKEILDEHPMDEAKSEDPRIEPMVDVQVPENTIDMSEAMPLAPSHEGQAMEANPMVEPEMDMSEAMPLEPSNEGPAMDANPMAEPEMDMSEAMPLAPSNEGEATMDANPMAEPEMDMSEAMPLEPSSEEQTTGENSMDEHANDHAMETETELEPQHL